jgi:hypothetical protein
MVKVKTKTQEKKTPKKTTSKKKSVVKSPALISSIETWRAHVIANWDHLKKQAESASDATPYQQLIIIAFTPIVPTNVTKLRLMLKIMRKLRYTQSLIEYLKDLYADKNYKRTASDLALSDLVFKPKQMDEQTGLDWLLMATGALSGLTKNTKSAEEFTQTLLGSLKGARQTPSAVRVQAGMISAGQDVIFAGGDVNVIQQYYQGDKAKLRSYLAKLRTDWIIPAATISPTGQTNTSANLHQLYTPIDIWMDESTTDPATNTQQLNEKRFQNIDSDHPHARISVLEKIATNPYVIVTGGAGSGKSTLCQFIVTALAYACDPAAEKREGIDGLDLLEASWIHGPMLPIYVSIRDFCNADKFFPKTMNKGTSDSLLKYIKTTLGEFAPFLEAYLTETDVTTQGTLLVLDGLDEVFKETDRMILQRIIETWAKRFPSCRIVVTSRTYAYRKGARWRLERFASAALAPYTWHQMASYIDNWYGHLVKSRSRAWDGQIITDEQATGMADDLKKTIHTNKTVLPLARQPLTLVLLTTIHESQKRLPTRRAKLYEETFELLERWKIPSPTDQLHKELAGIKYERMRAAFKMIAFDLQSQQKHYHHYPTTIDHNQLLCKLLDQQRLSPGGLGAPIEAILNYLATRNGILVSDTIDEFRFTHLTIQEYLAACALIEFYDECKMPDGTHPPSPEGWLFPDNIVALLRHDHFRWRNVALFVGSILSVNKGYDRMRWELIEKLLPVKITQNMPDTDLNCIGVAAEIWHENWLKVRLRISHGLIKEHLINCLTAIEGDERVDAPDRARNKKILNRLKNDDSDSDLPNTVNASA